MNSFKKAVGAVSLAALLSFFSGNIYAENSLNQNERVAETKSVRRLTESQMENLKKSLKNFNEKIKKESLNFRNTNSNLNLSSVIQNNSLYVLEEVKLSYAKTHNLGEDAEISANWYAGGELTNTRDVKNLRFGGEVGNFGFGAFIDPSNNKRVFNLKNKIGKNSIEIIAGNNDLMQGKVRMALPKIAEVNFFYDFNSHKANYSISKSYKNASLNVFQQFQQGLTSTSASLTYNPPKFLFLDKIVLNYSKNDSKNQQNDIRTAIGFQEKIGILNLEGRIDKTSLGFFPSIRGSIKHSWS